MTEPHVRLRHLATGGSQHVFDRQDRASRWVYKVPAIYPELMPSRQDVRLLAPSGRIKKLMVSALERWSPRRSEWVVSRYLRARRKRRFSTMLIQLADLRTSHLESIALPHRVVEHACLRIAIDGHPRSYRGPVLIQRRADHFFHRRGGLDRFRWADLVDHQVRLWAHGFGIADADTVVGPHNWALLEGRLYLADTASLTRSRERARRVLDPAVTGRLRERAIARFRRLGVEEPVERYFDFVLAELSPTRFDEVWNSP